MNKANGPAQAVILQTWFCGQWFLFDCNISFFSVPAVGRKMDFRFNRDFESSQCCVLFQFEGRGVCGVRTLSRVGISVNRSDPGIWVFSLQRKTSWLSREV